MMATSEINNIIEALDISGQKVTQIKGL